MTAVNANLHDIERQGLQEAYARIQYGFSFLNCNINTTPSVIRMEDLETAILRESPHSDLTLSALLRRFSKKPSDFEYRLNLVKRLAYKKEITILFDVLEDLNDSKDKITGLSDSALKIVLEEKTRGLKEPDYIEVIRFVLGLDAASLSEAAFVPPAQDYKKEQKHRRMLAEAIASQA